MRPKSVKLRPPRPADGGARLARALSKLGFCSRREACELVQAGRVRVNDVLQRDPERRVNLQRDQIEVDGVVVSCEPKVYLALNKPRGLVTSTADERGRDTVFECFAGANIPLLLSEVERGSTEVSRPARLPRIVPVGRLDKASEGLLLFTNDTAWADAITNPESHLNKTYHVQINCLADETLLQRMRTGTRADSDFLKIKRVSVVRRGEKNSWIEVMLDEGKNRHIRRLLAAFDLAVLRLVRVAIGPLQLGTLAKGRYRHLTDAEVESLTHS